MESKVYTAKEKREAAESLGKILMFVTLSKDEHDSIYRAMVMLYQEARAMEREEREAANDAEIERLKAYISEAGLNLKPKKGN